MYENPESRTGHVTSSLWSFTWPLLFLCSMTVLSMATQKHSGYVEPQTIFAQQSAQPSPGTAR